MIKNIAILCALLALFNSFADAQYYYKDLVSNKQARAEKATLKEQKNQNHCCT